MPVPSYQVFEVDLKDTFVIEGVETRVLVNFSGSDGDSWFHPAILKSIPRKNLPPLQLLYPSRQLDILHPTVQKVQLHDDGVVAAIKYRVFEYLSQIESLDLKAKVILHSTRWEEIKGSMDPDTLNGVLPFETNNDLGLAVAIVRDSTGIEWGPFNILPEYSPVKWPYSGRLSVKDGVQQIDIPITLDPVNGGFNVSDGVFNINLELDVALTFVGKLAHSNGDWRRVCREMFPNRRIRLEPKVSL